MNKDKHSHPLLNKININDIKTIEELIEKIKILGFEVKQKKKFSNCKIFK